MLLLMNSTFIAFTIISIMLLILNFISKKVIFDKEKSSPFECGFDPKSSSRMPFSIQFFLIAIIFLIFDVEIALLIPFILSLKYVNMSTFLITSNMFIFILLGGLYHEWNEGALKWLK